MAENSQDGGTKNEPRVISFVTAAVQQQAAQKQSEPTKPRRRRKPKRAAVELKCPLCESGVEHITYKDVYQLKKFTSARGKIIGASRTGMCAKHQRELTRAIKRARHVALMPYVSIDE